MNGGDREIIGWFFAVIVVFCAAFVIVFFVTILEHPWLLAPTALAVVIFFWARHEDRRTRVQIHTPPSRQKGESR